MKVKKFPQSHLVIEKNGKTLIIDPGYITFEKGFKVEDFQGADVYLITHQHEDHLGSETIKEVVGEKVVLGNSDVVKKLQEIGVTHAKELKNLEEVEIAGFRIKAVDIPHCLMQDGTPGPPNTGFLIDGVFFHPGDGDKNPGITSQNVALPIAGPSINLEGALKFAKDLKAKVVIPIHNDFFHNSEEDFKNMANPLGIEVRILSPGDSTEV